MVVEEFGPAAVEYADIRQSFPDGDTCVLRVDAELTGFEEAPAVLECAVFRDGREIDREDIQELDEFLHGLEQKED